MQNSVLIIVVVVVVAAVSVGMFQLIVTHDIHHNYTHRANVIRLNNNLTGSIPFDDDETMSLFSKTSDLLFIRCVLQYYTDHACEILRFLLFRNVNSDKVHLRDDEYCAVPTTGSAEIWLDASTPSLNVD